MLNLLIYDPPTSVMISDKELEIYTDFRDYIELQEVLESGSDNDAFIYMLGLFKNLPAGLDAAELVSQVVKFFRIEEEEEETGKGGKSNPVFSFDDDMPYILAGFRQYYGIDLMRIEYMHWWEFNALLMGIPEDSELKKRIGYRCMNPAKIKDKEERARVRKIQRRLKIKKSRQHYMSDDEIGAALW